MGLQRASDTRITRMDKNGEVAKRTAALSELSDPGVLGMDLSTLFGGVRAVFHRAISGVFGESVRVSPITTVPKKWESEEDKRQWVVAFLPYWRDVEANLPKTKERPMMSARGTTDTDRANFEKSVLEALYAVFGLTVDAKTPYSEGMRAKVKAELGALFGPQIFSQVPQFLTGENLQ
ncbi:MAG: hypothetical protein WC651_01850 [Candidatus Gracilibacteria bacterium]